MKKGLASIGNDGKSVNLHHVNQKNDGDILEILQSEHQSNYKQLHQNTGEVPSEINRKDFNQWRKEYWKQR